MLCSRVARAIDWHAMPIVLESSHKRPNFLSIIFHVFHLYKQATCSAGICHLLFSYLFSVRRAIEVLAGTISVPYAACRCLSPYDSQALLANTVGRAYATVLRLSVVVCLYGMYLRPGAKFTIEHIRSRI